MSIEEVVLDPMSESEFSIWAPRSRASYASDKMRANGLTQVEAQKIAEDDFSRLLPLGLQSKDNFLFTARDKSRNLVGFVWFCIRGSETKKAFICDLIIEEAHRGKGYGRRVMLLLEQEVRKHGLDRIGLHVFGFNESAIGLYRSLGFLTTDLIMEKSLSSGHPSHN